MPEAYSQVRSPISCLKGMLDMDEYVMNRRSVAGDGARELTRKVLELFAHRELLRQGVIAAYQQSGKPLDHRAFFYVGANEVLTGILQALGLALVLDNELEWAVGDKTVQVKRNNGYLFLTVRHADQVIYPERQISGSGYYSALRVLRWYTRFHPEVIHQIMREVLEQPGGS